MRKIWLLALIVTGLLLGMAATRWLSLPPPLRTEAAAGQFDAVRAKARLARVLGNEAPHPADSAASDGVRERLAAEIRALGLEPRVADRFACNNLQKSSGVSCSRVRNVLVTIGGGLPGKHLLVNSHYDSSTVGPGASDAGLGVASMLEVAALLKDRPLRRPVTFLFNEGEELGLIGARAFLDADPLSRNVDTLINLEARGTTGPVNMFETSEPNAGAVALYRNAVRSPVANSLAVSAYRLIPNSTDVSTFAEDRQWLTLNFAPIGNETRYHSPGDDLAAMDPATLQHMGDQVLQVASAVAGQDGVDMRKRDGERLFMNVGTRWLISFAPPSLFSLAALVLLVASTSLPGRGENGRGVLRGVLTALPLLLIAPLAGAAVAWIGVTLVGSVREGQFWRAHQPLSELAIYAGVIAAGIALLAAMRGWTVPQLRRAWWLLFVLVGILFSVFAPGAMVYFIIPPVIFSLGSLLGRRWPGVETGVAVLAALALFVTMGAALGLIQDLVNSGPLWILALFGGMVLMPWLIEAKPLLGSARWSRVAAVAAAFAALAWLPAALAPAYSADRQQQWTLQYVVGAGPDQPFWSVVNDRKPLPEAWREFGQWRLGTLPLGTRQRWLSPARPVEGFVPARALPAEAVARPGGRRVRLRLQANGADSIVLLAPEGAAIAGLGIPGQVRAIDSKGTKGPYTLSCTGRSCDGQVVELLVGPQPVKLQVTGTRWALPAAAAPLMAARPAHARPQYQPDATITIERIRI
ncbi:MFS family permease [Sphingomonas kaistensis]|uniref:Vacuolar membrane protease n=1 Tax=Sphingomonas kaistensis TaxID=298708 RepID=A0A7X5Y6Q1_9SPHN|nr:M20/M25/M40 family metallo-hydrolase [Sphingomonas kaistensis]NJC06147.1 MFS family permease [Sphingomonas kaistensis]